MGPEESPATPSWEAEPGLPSGYRLLAFDTLASTNATALEAARAGASAGTVVWARRQTEGRGRRGRNWESFDGNLYVSIILRPQVSLATAAQLGFAGALAVAEAIEMLAPSGPAVALKWPNDVLVRGRKIAGVLLESYIEPDGRLAALVLGVGVNVAAHPGDGNTGDGHPVDGAMYPTTALQAEPGAGHVGAEALLSALIRAFDGWYGSWRTAGFAPLRAAWLARAKGLGTPVAVRLPRETRHGIFQDLDETGALCLAAANGRIDRIHVGDVFFGEG